MHDEPVTDSRKSPNSAMNVTHLSAGNRLCLPADLLRAVGWLQGEKVEEIYAELVEPGRIRLKRLVDGWPAIEKRRSILADEAKDDELARETLSALNDKYRKIAFYRDGRIRLVEAMAVFLGFEPPDRPYLGIRLMGEHIEILSLEKRNQLLQAYGLEI